MFNKYKRIISLLLISFFIINALIFILYSDKLISMLFYSRSTAFQHYKIARDIKANYSDDIVNGLNKWMLDNYMTIGIEESFLPILDKGSYFRLIDGYSACDGAADTYIRIGEFLELKGYTVPLYDKNHSSPHTVVTFFPKDLYKNKKRKLNKDDYFKVINNYAAVIDPVHNISFNNGEYFATFKDICENKFNNNEKDYLNIKNGGYLNFQYFCLAYHMSSQNDPLNDARISKKFFYFVLDLIPEFLLFKIYENYINQSHKDDDFFLKARNHHLFGNFELAKKYYNLSILKNFNNKYDVTIGASRLDDDYYNNYIKSLKPVSIAMYSKFFLTILGNEEKNILQENPFVIEEEPFYNLYANYYNKKINYNENIK